MIPLQAPPIIPDKGTLDLLIGPYGALMLLAIMLSVAGWFIWRLIGRSDAQTEAINKLHAESADKLLGQQKEYAAKLEALLREMVVKFEQMTERLIKGEMDSTAQGRDLTAQIRDLANLIRAAMKLP